MKKTRKVLSIALAILVAFGSMPMLYTSTVAAGTADNPTTAFEESNPYEYDDLFKLNLKHSNNDFFFYQTIDDEYFVVNQSLYLQQYKVALGSNRTLSFHGINFYEGGSNVADSVDNAGVVEQPTITTNETTDFLTNYYAAGYETWTSTHENSAGLDCTGAGGSFDLHASGYDLNGRHKQYTWDHRVVFKGNSADVKGQIDTGYYERLTWDWVSDDSAASMDFRIKTTITVVDAREFVKAIAKANDALANPDQHGVGYVSAIEAVMTSIPDDAENLTARYDQATLDKYAEDINAIKEDAADYTEYNYLYNQYSSMTNDSEIYSGQSFTAFKEAIKSIDNGLSKELSGADQQIVNDAVAALRNAYETILINNATLTPDVNHTATIEEMTVTVGTEFNLIQVKDNQAFSLAQPWTIGHNKSQARKFAVTLDTSDTDTNTFISHLDSTSYGTQDFDNKALSQTGATVFTCWDELDANGSFKDSSDFINKDTRTINAGYDGFKKGNTYYLQSTPIFYGKTAVQTDTDTAIQYFYTQNFYVGWVNVLGFGGGSGSSAFKTTINITDARGLVKAYEQAGVILSLEESNYTENFLSSLQTAYNAVPKDMVQGIKYYDQATVNATSKTLTDLLNNPETYADYTAYNNKKAEADAIINAGNNGVYEETAFESFVSGVTTVDSTLDKNLTSVNQTVIDTATSDIASLIATLEANKYADYTELNNAKDAAQAIVDNPSAYSPETVEEVRKALEEANTVPENMVVGENNVNQDTIDAAADKLNSVVNSATPLDGDYTEYNQAKAEIDAILNAGNVDENGNPIYNEEVFTNVTNYVTSVDTNLDKNLKADNQSTINEATNALVNAKEFLNSYKYADYSAFDDAKAELEEIVANPDKYTDATVDAAQEALDNANTVPGDMYVGENNVNQDTIDAATDAMEQVIANKQEKADYTDFEEALGKLDEILNAPEGTYTDKTIEAAQAAKDAADALDKDLPSSEQGTVDSVTDLINGAVSGAEEKADYTEFDKVVEDLENIVNNPNKYTEETVKNAQDALEEANGVDKDLSSDDQSTLDEITNNLKDVVNNAQEKADYTDFNTAYEQIEEIVSNPDKYTSETVEAAQAAKDAADALDKDLPSSEQGTVDSVTDAMEQVIANKQEKADYTDFNEALDKLDEILNAPEGTYTDKTIEAAQAAKDAADALDKDLPASEQDTVDSVTDLINGVVDNADKKADYTEFDKVVEDLENIVNNPDKYTEETVKNAQDALEEANGVDKDLSSDDQETLDEITNNLKDVVNNAQEKADYTDYNNAKAEADSIVNDDGNGNPIYDEDAFNAYKEAVNNIDTALDKDLPASEQETVDNAVTELESLKATLENNKKADYTDFNAAKDVLEEIVANPDKYTDATVDAAQEALDNANMVPDNMVVGENNANQNIIDAATDAMEQVIANAQEKADYTEFDKVVEDLENIVNNPDKYTEETVKNAQDALEEANGVDKDLSSDDQAILDEITNGLKDVVNNAQEKADYTDFNEALGKLDEILNAPEGTYTDKTIEAAQAAKDAADALDKDLPASEQGTVDSVTDLINGVVDNADKKADYTDFDKVVEDLENIVNNPDKYTEETVKNAQDALDEANGVDKDLSSDDQETLDEITNNLKDVVNNAQEKADYTDYNNAKAEADSIVNDDGNGNPIYDEDAFNAYKEAVNNIDTALDKDLPASEQETVDNAVTELESLKATLEAKKYYTVTFKDAEGNVLGTSSYVNGDVFGNLTAPALPQDTDTTAYVGWVYADGTLAKADDVVSGDMDVTVASEAKKLIAKDESGVAIDEVTSFISGIEAGTTVEEVLSKFDNDELVIEIKTYEGVDLSSEELVGTGSTITLKSKYTGVVYETRMFIIMGDVDGDGDIDGTDFEISKSVGFESYTYPEEHNYFFVANDIDENGIINVLDAFYIGRMKTV